MKTVAIIAAFAGCASALICSSAGVAEETDKQCKLRLMKTTRMVAVMGNGSGNLVQDSDLNTLQVVFLEPRQGKSRVSDDGQVIFLNDPTDDEQQALIDQAFDIRVKLGFCSKTSRP